MALAPWTHGAKSMNRITHPESHTFHSARHHLSTLAIGLVLAFPALASAAGKESTFAPFSPDLTRQPWGTGELVGTNARESTVFEMQEPWSAAFSTVTGEMLLPDIGVSVTLPGMTIAMGTDGRTPRITPGARSAGRRTNTKVKMSDEAKTNWIPFSVCRMGIGVTATAGSESLSARVEMPNPSARSLALQLSNRARVRNVKVTLLPPGMSVMALDHLAPTTQQVAKAAVPTPALDRNTVPVGLTTVDGVPFLIGKGVVDVQFSMSQATFSRRVKDYYPWAPNPSRPVVVAPGRDYAVLHVLAFSREVNGCVPRMTLCYGRCVGWAGLMEEEVVPVPDFRNGGASDYVVSRVPTRLTTGDTGWLYHLRIPVPRTANYWFSGNTDFEFTRDKFDLHNMPDPNEFGRVPAGLPSSVVVVSATAERAPAQLTFVQGEPGNVFHETQTPQLTFSLTNRSNRRIEGRLTAHSEGPGTAEESNVQRAEWTVEQPVALAPGEARTVSVNVMPSDRKRRGWFDVGVALQVDGNTVQEYRTTYAILAPDTRKAMQDSPFGVWSFWWPHASFARRDRQVTDIASLILKGGWRWTYGGSANDRGRSGLDAETLYNQYKITYTLRSAKESYQRGKGWWDAAAFETQVGQSLRRQATNSPVGQDRTYKVLHESRSSNHLIRRLSEFLGGSPYSMPDKERATVDAQFSNVVQYCSAIKRADPNLAICLINDYPAVGIEYMKRGMPKDAFDCFGTEMANFMREPERQPDWLCLLGILRQWNLAKQQYGYQDKPIWTTEALYHSTNPGNLSLHMQAVIQCREAILALANGVERMCAAGCLADCTDDYRWSNWGQSGFCFREPEMNPKPNYAMYAWLTQVLDQAKYAGKVDHDSTSLHVLDFVKPDGTHVYPIWCVRGKQEVRLAIRDGAPAVVDAYGNPLNVTLQDGVLTVPVCDTPIYVTGAVIGAVTARAPVEVAAAAGRKLFDFSQPGSFTVVSVTNALLEANWDYPRIKGTFAVDCVQEEGKGVVKLELQDDADPRKLLGRYVELTLNTPLVIRDRLAALTVRTKGNGGWGRVMVEMTDAEGRIWTSCGNQYSGSCNAADNRGDSFISFDGWQTVTIAMPGRLPARDVLAHLPGTTDWWPSNTPERRQELAKFEAAKAAYAQKMENLPIAQKAYETLQKQWEAQQEAYKKAKTDYDQEQGRYRTETAAQKAARSSYSKAKANYEKAVKQGKKDVQEPQPPPEPKAPSLALPVAPPEAPKAPVAPKPPMAPRDYGVATVTYPIRLTKVMVAMPPSVLYVNDEVPVRNRVIALDQVCAIPAPEGM
jgi:hypothetical protein